MSGVVCRSCGAPVLWVQSAASGKLMPLNLPPEKRVVVHKREEVDATAPNGPAYVGTVEDVYVSHFATCPNAAQHRRG